MFKLPRHLEHNHKNEEDVAKILALPSKSKHRRLLWKEITRKGDYQANIQSIKNNSGKISVARQFGNTENMNDFVPCTFCYGFFHARTLYKHSRNCFKRPRQTNRTVSKSGNLLRSSRALLDTAVTDDSFREIQGVLAKMQRNELHLIIRNDQSFLLYGTIMLQKKEKERFSDIRYSLRCLARLLVEFRRNSGKESARGNELVLPENYDLILNAAKVLSGYQGPRCIKTPSLFLKIGFCLKNLAEYCRCVALKTSDQNTVDLIRNFVELYESDWQIYATNARATYENRKANKPEELPLESDVKLFRTFILTEINRIMKNISSGALVLQELKDLSKYTLARIMSFNARRGGEVSKLKLIHWEGVEDKRWKRKTDIEALDDVEKKLAERLEVCYIEGKKKKGSKSALVPILFTDETVKAIRVLIQHRDFLGVESSNEYVFASGELFLRGWDTLQAITKRIANLEKPQLITPTRTRKFLATLLQLMDMNDAELTWLTNHFGHCKNTHFQWYRKEDATIELTKVAKVLVAVDNGKSVKNKKIDDVGETCTSNKTANDDYQNCEDLNSDVQNSDQNCEDLNSDVQNSDVHNCDDSVHLDIDRGKLHLIL